jgi:GDPmannose 4,6-dehydratase
MALTALISGVTGQTGAYLAHSLIAKGYNVIGASRDADSANVSSLKALGILGKLQVISLAPADFRSVLQAIQTHTPDHIYYLAGQTSVGLSFEQPFEAFESIAIGTLNFLEAIRLLSAHCRFFNAGSTECFGEADGHTITEQSPMRPKSPYAVAKATSYWITSNYRNSYGMFACTGLLSNHESPLRPTRFVTSKVVSGIKSIKSGTQNTLELGNLAVARDWGWAPDYADAIHRMLSADTPDDYIVATGKTHSLMDLIYELCILADLDPDQIIKFDSSLLRPTDLSTTSLSPDKILRNLGWKSSTNFLQLVKNLYSGQLF